MAAGATDTLNWTLGLLASNKKYLTAEKFQNKVVCSGATLKKKQIWTLVKVKDEVIALKSSTNKFLTSDKDGKVDCSGDGIDADQKFTFETQDDGRVAIKSVTHGRYIGGSGDHMTGFDQSVSMDNLFIIHLALHPQVNIKNINRKTYMHLNEDTQELCCTEELPWGYDATIILEFHDGKYALRAANTKYLAANGKLQEDVNADCLFQIVFKGSQVAFRDKDKKFLTAVGASATVQSRKSTIGKDELFELMDSRPQVQLLASNGKYLSIREGIEVRAKQSEVSDKEIFQMEPVSLTDFSGNVKWRFRSCNNKLLRTGATITADSDSISDEATHFTIDWQGAMVALKANNGKYVSIKPNGQTTANSDTIEDNCKYVFEFINRPILVIRGEFGFVGVKGGSGTLECNRSQYDVFGMIGKAGTYSLRGANGKYFKIESDQTVSINGDEPTDFFLELRAPSRMVIILPNGKYLHGQQSGKFSATGDKVEEKTLWEY